MSEPQDTEKRFFNSLVKGDGKALENILSDDFILIDVMSGSEISKPALLAVIGSGDLKFDAIDTIDSHTRQYGSTAVITGQTHMKGRYKETSFTANSRYTHVYSKQEGQWRLVSAQGTQIVSGAG